MTASIGTLVISTGATDAMYTLRHSYKETVTFHSPNSFGAQTQIVNHWDFWGTLSTDFDKALEKARKISAQSGIPLREATEHELREIHRQSREEAETTRRERIAANEKVDAKIAAQEATAIIELYGKFADKIDAVMAYEGTDQFINDIQANITNARYLTEKMLNAAIGAINAKNSEFVGEVGQKKVLFSLTQKNVVPIQSMYGIKYINIMEDENGNVVVYRGSKVLEDGKVQATIKEHTVYRDVKQTIIERPKVV